MPDLAALPWRTAHTIGLEAVTEDGSVPFALMKTAELAEQCAREHNEALKAATGRCPCGHGPDDICLNSLIYGNCGDENCGGSCTDTGTCRSLPGCCDEDREP
jgi:hypothetical protein